MKILLELIYAHNQHISLLQDMAEKANMYYHGAFGKARWKKQEIERAATLSRSIRWRSSFSCLLHLLL